MRLRLPTALMIAAAFPCSNEVVIAQTSTIEALTRRIDDLEQRDARQRETIAELRDGLRALEGRRHEHETAAEVTAQERAQALDRLAGDVLADADTRVSCLGSGLAAGWDDGFFLASEDGVFDLRIKGLVQTRFLANVRDGAADDTLLGFEVARANLFLSGSIGDPRIGYLIVLASGAAGDFVAESAKLTYAIDDTLSVFGGRFRDLAFLREEAISYTKQLTIERSTVNEVFTLDYVEGVGVDWRPGDQVRLQAVLHDGARSSRTAFSADGADVAANVRLDVLLAGSWTEAESFTALGTQDTSSMIGAAVSYEASETGTSAANDRFLSWTVDGSLEHGGLALFGAVVGRHGDSDTTPDLDQYGVVAQVSQLLGRRFEPYVRYEWIRYDGFAGRSAAGPTAGDLRILTAGFNCYVHAHQVKFTADAMYAFDAVPTARSFTGLLDDAAGEDGQIVFRTQLQFMF